MENIWTDEELMFVLYLYFKRKEGFFLKREEIEYHKNMLNKTVGKDRSYDSIILRLSNYQYLDTRKGMSHVGRALEIWNKYSNDFKKIEDNYKNIMMSFDIRKDKLLETGIKNGCLTIEEIVDCFNGMSLSEEELDIIYAEIVNNEIEVISANDLGFEDSNVGDAFEKHLITKGIFLNDYDKENYIKLFSSLRELVNNKLTYRDIIGKYDQISDQMKLLPQDDRIKVPYYELKEQYKDLLTKEEIEYFLFAIWYGECVVIADNNDFESKSTYGNSELISVEIIKNLKNQYYSNKHHYDKFHFE